LPLASGGFLLIAGSALTQVLSQNAMIKPSNLSPKPHV
jgi:hypothetical protein